MCPLLSPILCTEDGLYISTMQLELENSVTGVLVWRCTLWHQHSPKKMHLLSVCP